MKRLGNPTDGDHDQINNDSMYTSSDFQTMLDGLDEGGFIDETGHVTPAEKKRRLSVDQVKALEKNFEVENKLEPERKLKLAQELGLQPRQVAVWFQNRRARYKSKQLERDYGVLEANYDGLKLNYEKLRRDNEALLKEINGLKAKLSEVGKSELLAAKEDAMVLSDAENKKPNNLETDQVNVFLDPKSEDEAIAEEATEMKINGDLDNDTSGDDNILLCDSFNNDGSCDSDSSAILNEEYMNYNNNNNSPNAAISSSYQLSFSKANSGERINGVTVHREYENNDYHHQPMKIEEHNLFVHEEESCTDLFSDDQAPSLTWICSDDWN